MPDVTRLSQRARQVVLDQPSTLGDGDCEALRNGVLGQPVNTLTSFAYVGAGAWVAARAARLSPGARRGAFAYAALTAITGVGSVAYHGPQFDGAQFLHDVPIAGVFAIGAVVPIWRRVRGRAPVPGWSPRLGATMALTTAVAGASYLAGRTTSPLCRPDSLLQPHGLWHLGTATVIALWGAALWSPEPLELDGSAEQDGPHEQDDARRSPHLAEELDG